MPSVIEDELQAIRHEDLRKVLTALAEAIEGVQKDVDMLVKQLQIAEEIKNDIHGQ